MANQIEDDYTGDLQLLKVRLMIESEEYEKAEELLNSYPPDDFDPIMVANMFMEAHFSDKAIDWLKKHGQGMVLLPVFSCVSISVANTMQK